MVKLKKLNKGQLHIAPFREKLTSNDHTVLPATHTFIHEWNEPSFLYSPAAAHHRTLVGTHFPSHRGQEADLAWVAGYISRWYARPKTVTHPNTTRPIVRRPGLNSWPLLSRKSDALKTRLPSHPITITIGWRKTKQGTDHGLWVKNVPLNSCSRLSQMLTDLQKKLFHRETQQ